MMRKIIIIGWKENEQKFVDKITELSEEYKCQVMV